MAEYLLLLDIYVCIYIYIFLDLDSRIISRSNFSKEFYGISGIMNATRAHKYK